MIRREFDEKTGIVYVHGSGLWNFSDIETHDALIRAVGRKLRSAGGRSIRLLSDVTQGSRQAACVEDYIVEQMTQTFVAGDRVALLVDSDANQFHLQSLISTLDLAAFTSSAEALKWLTSASRIRLARAIVRTLPAGLRTISGFAPLARPRAPR